MMLLMNGSGGWDGHSEYCIYCHLTVSKSLPGNTYSICDNVLGTYIYTTATPLYMC